ncbi:hypothetical protein PO909_009970 [Leuciscus waleckii]
MPLTFVLSAIWHGVYPGYYFTFITAIPITLAARTVRRNFREDFLSSRQLKICYDVVTWAATQMTICYTVMPFLLLAIKPTMQYYSTVTALNSYSREQSEAHLLYLFFSMKVLMIEARVKRLKFGCTRCPDSLSHTMDKDMGN